MIAPPLQVEDESVIVSLDDDRARLRARAGVPVIGTLRVRRDVGAPPQLVATVQRSARLLTVALYPRHTAELVNIAIGVVILSPPDLDAPAIYPGQDITITWRAEGDVRHVSIWLRWAVGGDPIRDA